MKDLSPIVFTTFALLLSGCVTTKYQFAAANRPHAATLDLRPVRSPIDIHLDAIVSRGAPGSWKHDALWDEYELFLANRTQRSWRFESVHLVTASGRTLQPGTDPWELEELTADWWRQSGVDAANDVAWGVGQAANLAAGAMAKTSVGALQLGAVVSPDAAVLMVGVITATATVSMVLKAPAAANAKSKEEIADEFQRRRKALLAPLPAGRETRGSAFFPITTQARQLVLVCRSGAEICTVTIDLPAVQGSLADESGSAETRDLRIVPANLMASY